MDASLNSPVKDESPESPDSGDGKRRSDLQNCEPKTTPEGSSKALVLSLKRQDAGEDPRPLPSGSSRLSADAYIKQESPSPSQGSRVWQKWPWHQTAELTANETSESSSSTTPPSLQSSWNFPESGDSADSRHAGHAALKRPKRVPFATEETTNSPPHIFTRLLDYPEIIHSIGANLEVEQLFSLYCVSKDFHRMVNTRFSTTIMAQAQSKCPESAAIFHYKMYDRLCIVDPGLNVKYTHPGRIRDVPSFRWLRMIMMREKVVGDIFQLLRARGHRLPRQTTQSIKKIWHMMDIPDNRRRIGLVHNSSIWTNRDIFLSTMFLIKLDMFFTDPLRGSGSTEMRQTMMAQRSLSVLWDVMSRKMMLNHYDMMLLKAEWSWNLRPDETEQTFFGMPAHRVGRLQYEGFRTNVRVRLYRPDELIMAESFRRNMKLNDRYMDMILWGYVNPKTFENVDTVLLPCKEASRFEESEIDPQLKERMEEIADWIGFEKMKLR